nr:hypothetical protein [Tanacetum cinerariifolium]
MAGEESSQPPQPPIASIEAPQMVSSVKLLILKKALKDNPTPSSVLLTKSSSTFLNSLLEETNTFHNSLPEFENFYFDLGEISSGSTTTHSDISLSEYDSFIFNLAHEEFVDELAHIISPPEYDRFYFKDLPNPSELMYVLNSGIRENLSTTLVNLPIEDDHSPLLAYVVWIFLAYLTYPVIPPYLYQFGNEDTIFDPGITINHFYSFKPVSSHRHGAFMKFNTHRSHLNEWPMTINGKNTPFLDVLLFHFYPLDQVNVEGDAINFSKNRSFPDDEFLNLGSKVTQCFANTEYFLYIPAYENITPIDSPIIQDSVSFKGPPEFTSDDDHPNFDKHDHFESVDNLKHAEIQDNAITEPISDTQSLPTTISSSAEVIPQSLVP